MGQPDRDMWAGDDRYHTTQGPPIITRLEGPAPKINVCVSTETYDKVAGLAQANGWTFTRAARFLLASGLNATRAFRRDLTVP